MALSVRSDVPTILTFVVVLAWVFSIVLRAFNPAWTGGQALDTGVMLVLGYWFVTRRNGAKP